MIRIVCFGAATAALWASFVGAADPLLAWLAWGAGLATFAAAVQPLCERINLPAASRAVQQ